MTTAPDLVDAYLKAKAALFEHIDAGADDLEDHRGVVWDGDTDHPMWDWDVERRYCLGPSRVSVEKDGLVFIWIYGSDGQLLWIVFDKDKIEHHEE